EPVQPVAQVAIGAVVNGDGVDGILGAKVHFPPRVGPIFGRVRLSARVVGALRVAVDGALGFTAMSDAALRGLALPGDVTAVAHYLHFGQRKRTPLAGKLD